MEIKKLKLFETNPNLNYFKMPTIFFSTITLTWNNLAIFYVYKLFMSILFIKKLLFHSYLKDQFSVIKPVFDLIIFPFTFSFLSSSKIFSSIFFLTSSETSILFFILKSQWMESNLYTQGKLGSSQPDYRCPMTATPRLRIEPRTDDRQSPVLPLDYRGKWTDRESNPELFLAKEMW